MVTKTMVYFCDCEAAPWPMLVRAASPQDAADTYAAGGDWGGDKTVEIVVAGPLAQKMDEGKFRQWVPKMDRPENWREITATVS